MDKQITEHLQEICAMAKTWISRPYWEMMGDGHQSISRDSYTIYPLGLDFHSIARSKHFPVCCHIFEHIFAYVYCLYHIFLSCPIHSYGLSRPQLPRISDLESRCSERFERESRLRERMKPGTRELQGKRKRGIDPYNIIYIYIIFNRN